ncbi:MULTISPECIES: uroporphyrinogen-III synthase [unclassified Campylobacter]|uniref:uroporphyrinogen-III synthase n=1 Tax=unclassified Campylobacter TaxID=2593542 RepID=UPI0012382238|nr:MULTISPECIES: uroporphyrinogen-III synthase [unclassified Campylobacter]KAA6227533.1 uroporphyrinogen-III synthase [Campylobacter sp. LR196d]KAA6228560.1 uroporphyrinogen-III synthase [Campylobacter sp. LR286c]KAA6230950.1 uroporphyrinogen-III synthase [Campylobacter sp. LR291e]KAA6233584.1 uroporphyrinogen-III synthase [Campylobacter sp. LR264d]
MQIYFLGEDKFEGVENLILNEFKFFHFDINFNDFDALIISSKNALRALEFNQIKPDFNKPLFAVGEKSAKKAIKMGFKKVKFPKLAYGKNLVNEFKNELKNKHCLYLRAKQIASNLDFLLINEGVKLSQIIAYENIYKHSNLKLIRPCVFIFSSPLQVSNFLKTYKLEKDDKCVVIGQSTKKALKDFENVFLSKDTNLNSCVKLAKKLANFNK